MTRTREAFRRQTHPVGLILWLVLAGLGLCTDLAVAPSRVQLEERP